MVFSWTFCATRLFFNVPSPHLKSFSIPLVSSPCTLFSLCSTLSHFFCLLNQRKERFRVGDGRRGQRDLEREGEEGRWEGFTGVKGDLMEGERFRGSQLWGFDMIGPLVRSALCNWKVLWDYFRRAVGTRSPEVPGWECSSSRFSPSDCVCVESLRMFLDTVTQRFLTQKYIWWEGVTLSRYVHEMIHLERKPDKWSSSQPWTEETFRRNIPSLKQQRLTEGAGHLLLTPVHSPQTTSVPANPN